MSRQFASVIVMRASEAELDKNEANGVPRQPGDSVRFDDICYGNYDTECLVDVALKAVDHGESVATKAALDDFYSHIREYNSSLSGEMKGMLAKVLDLPIQKPSGGDGMMAVTLVNNPDEILKKMDAGGAKPLDNAPSSPPTWRTSRTSSPTWCIPTTCSSWSFRRTSTPARKCARRSPGRAGPPRSPRSSRIPTC